MAVNFVATEVDDSFRWFVEEKMKLLGEYVESECNAMYEREHHTLVHINKQGTIDAFGMVHKVDDMWLFGYSWHDGSRAGRVAYIRGIDTLLTHFSPIGIQEHELHVKKLKRLIEGL